MRYFKCFDCEHFWNIIFWEDGKDTKLACPECKSLNVHRIEKIHGWDREGKYISLVKDEDHEPTSRGKGPTQSELSNKGTLPTNKTTIKILISIIRAISVQGKLNGFIERFVKHSP
jgi:hypothetical protein